MHTKTELEQARLVLRYNFKVCSLAMDLDFSELSWHQKAKKILDLKIEKLKMEFYYNQIDHSFSTCLHSEEFHALGESINAIQIFIDQLECEVEQLQEGE